MRILFWNTHNNVNINAYLSSIIKDYEIDLVVLAEYKADEQELYNMVRENQQWLIAYPTIGCDRIRFYGNLTDVEPSVQSTYYSIQVIKNKYILCGVHLPSDLHEDNSRERYSIARQIMDDVHKEEIMIGMTNTIIVGDINDMPYADSCICADAFHGLPICGNGARDRTIKGKKYIKYYNPMWNLFGDFSYPPGTYYRSGSSLYAPMWHMLDQFILGHDIVPLLIRDQLRIITGCSYGELSNQSGYPDINISDHFPIMCEISDL